MSHVMRKVFATAALAFFLTGIGPVMAQDVMTDAAFFRLCAKGTVEEVSQALESGANIGAKDAQGMTVLMYAAKDNAAPAVMKVLLDAVAAFNKDIRNILQKVDVNAKDKRGKTALMFASENNSLEVVRVLLEAKADVNAKDKRSKTALIFAVENNVPGVVQVLLENRANISVEDIELAKKRESDVQEVVDVLRKAQRARIDGAFLRLCAKGTAEEVRQALKFGANIGAKDAEGMTTLMYAARDNANPEVIKVLLDAAATFNEDTWNILQKVDVNAGNRDGRTALMFAVENKSRDVVEVLLTRADVNVKDKQSVTALMLAVRNNLPDVVQALLDAGANANAKDKQDRTALMRAMVEKASPEMVKMLLDAGADANVKGKQDVTALMLAVENKLPDVVRVLLDARADANVKDKQDKTVLMRAVDGKCSPEMVKMLLDAGADANIKDKQGMTALMWATKTESCQEVIQLLQERSQDASPNSLPDDDFLQLCAKRTAEEIRKALEEDRARINVKDKDGMTMLMYAARENLNPEVMKVLLKAAVTFNNDIQNILQKVDINAGNKEDKTALMFAAENNSPDVMRVLLNAGAKIGAKDTQGKTALMMYAARDNAEPEVMRELLKAARGEGVGPFNVDINDSDKEGKTTLVYAVEGKCNPEVVKELLKAGAVVKAEDIELAKERKTNVQEVVEMLRTAQKARIDRVFLGICAEGTAKDVNQALEFGANIGAKDDQDMTTLMYAAKSNADPAVMKVLLDAAAAFNKDIRNILQKVDVNAGNKEGKTVLMFAAESNSSDVVQVLLKAGADVNAKDKQDRTVLIWAVVGKAKPEVISMLLDVGADINVKDKQNMTPLMFAVKNNSSEIVQVLLDAGANVSAGNRDGVVALMWAVKNSNLEVVQALLNAGAKADVSDEKGITPLMLAVEKNSPEIMQVLLNAGAKADVGDENGVTLLMLAAEGKSPKVVQVLLNAGANVNARNRDGITALMLAAGKNEVDPKAVVKMLLSAGANVHARDAEGENAFEYAWNREKRDINVVFVLGILTYMNILITGCVVIIPICIVICWFVLRKPKNSSTKNSSRNSGQVSR